MSRVPDDVRRRVIERANHRCEYCRFPETASLLTFEMEHVISEKHGGPTVEDNLALACPHCNRAKGSDIGSLDPQTSQLVPFFNPRSQLWQEHFRLEAARIVPLTAEGRVTVAIFQLNRPDRLQERERLIATNLYPA
jgi:5-methylcytosine-specific restriction endonuclease McrA